MMWSFQIVSHFGYLLFLIGDFELLIYSMLFNKSCAEESKMEKKQNLSSAEDNQS